MSLYKELKKRARYVAVSLFGICFIGYSGFYLVLGENGIIAKKQILKRIEDAQVIAKEVRMHRNAYEVRVRLLDFENMDPDMLEERARVMLNYGYHNDIVILDPTYRRNG